MNGESFGDLFLAIVEECILPFTLRQKRSKSWLSDEAYDQKEEESLLPG